jgi:trans-2,3-dihydro-3-hydroxyanthranilate isomerase
VTARYPYRLVDVFTDRPFAGNQLAVFSHADGLSDARMQAIAAELNLSETTFVHSSTIADHRLRIFTPGLEMKFAGHPTIGAAWVIAEGRSLLRLELPVGVLEASVDGSMVDLETATPEFVLDLDSDRTAKLADALGLAGGGLSHAPAVVSCGTPYLVVPFARIDDLRSLDARRGLAAVRIANELGADLAMVAPGNAGVIAEADVHVRVMSDPAVGPLEDAATGSAAVPVCALLGRTRSVAKALHRIVIEQGVEMGRPSRLDAEVDFDVGGRPTGARLRGSVVPIGHGTLEVPDER